MKKNYARVKLKIKDIRVSNDSPYIRSGNSLVSISKAEAGKRFASIKDGDSKVKKFFGNVKKRIDKGQMVAWSMLVGLLPENGRPARQGGGGHMRMFIGYNEKTDELIFSD